MSFFSKRKRKNDDPPRFPAWMMLLIAFGLVGVALIVFRPEARQISPSVSNLPQDGIELTATYIIIQATAMAQGIVQPSHLDPIEITATYIIGQATRQASTSSP